MRRTREYRTRHRQFFFFRGQKVQTVGDVFAGKETRQTFRNHARNTRRRQFIRAGQNPFAAFVILTDNARAFRIFPVVHVFLHLRFDERTFFFNDNNVFEAAREFADTDRLQRPGHADLVHADTDIFGFLMTDAEIFERLQYIEIALAGGDDTETRFRRIENGLVDFIRACECNGGFDRVLMQTHFLIQRRIRPANIQTAIRQFKITGQYDIELMRIDVDRCGRLDGFGNRLEADPATGKATHRPTEQTHVENILHAGRIEHRHHRGNKFQFRTMRQGRRTTSVIIGS